MIQTINVPEIGENVDSGVVVTVHINVGDTVAVDDTVIELETDKAIVEIPSPIAGRVTEVLANAGALIRVGDVIARVETEKVAAEEQGAAVPVADNGVAPSVPADQTVDAVPAPSPPTTPADGLDVQPVVTETKSEHPPAPAAPSIRRLARELGVTIDDVDGSGPGGRITKADINTHVRQQLAGVSGRSGAPPLHVSPAMPDFRRWGTIDIVEMDTVRRLTAQNTATAWRAIPHVTQFDEADITGVMAFIKARADQVEKAGARLTVTAIITRVCAHALKLFPRFNASIDAAANRIIFKRYVHIGIATDTPRGLLVPVIRNADFKSIIELAKTIGDMAMRARNKKIKPDELEGGTFTISNQGGIGGVGFAPIIFWPQVAVLGVSQFGVKPVYIGDRFEPRTVLPLSLSYDHRIIDGADAARFLRWICEGLEQPLTLLLE